MSPRRPRSPHVPFVLAGLAQLGCLLGSLPGCAPDEDGLFGNSGAGGALSSGATTSSIASGPGATTSTSNGPGSGGSASTGSGGAGASGSGGEGPSSGSGATGSGGEGPGSGGSSSVGPGSGGGGGSVGPGSGPTSSSVGSGGAGGQGQGGSTTGSGGQGGAAPECQNQNDCASDTACADHACVGGLCTVTYVPAGTPIDPVAGDCVHDECNGAGVLLEDVPDAPGTYCDGEGVCDGATVCVGCLGPDDCDSGYCENQTCLPCDDGGDCASGLCACQVCVDRLGLFISEYIEGSVSNKAIELFNPTDEVIDLDGDGCEILIYANGAGEPTSAEAIEGTIAPGDTRSICAVGSGFGLSCDQLTLNLGFNGDDAVEIVCGGTTLDVVGRIGEDPGTEWGNGNVSTADNTLRRRPGIVAGDPDGSDAFDPSFEWIGRPNNDSDDLNDHTLCP